MPLIDAKIPNLLGGVSQQPPALRSASQVEEQINGLSRVSDGGPSKRPGTRHLAKLVDDVTGFANAFVHALSLSATERFFLTIANEALRVFDRATGLSQAITFLHGEGYITLEPSDPVDILADTFTDTNGTSIFSHVSDAGLMWLDLAHAGTPLLSVQGNVIEQAFNSISDKNVCMFPLALPQNDYTASIRGRPKTNIPSAVGRLEIRVRGNLSDQACYAARFNVNTSNYTTTIQKYQADGTASTQLGTGVTVSQSLFDDEYHTFACRVTGNFLEILVDDEVVYSVSDVSATYPTQRYTGFMVDSPSSSDRRWLLDDYRIVYTPPTEESADKYRAVTVDDRTFIVNTTKTVLRGSDKAPVQVPTALLYVDQADFGTIYAVTVDGETVRYETPAGADASTRRLISTDNIASGIKDLLDGVLTGFEVTQFGSILRLRKTDESEFTIAATDGLADNGVIVVKGKVQRSTDLPLRCIDDFVLEVTGGPEEAKDTYWVKFDADGSDDYRGTWVECARPGEGIAFDPTTMPHELIYSDELSAEVSARGFPKMPVVSPVNPVKDFESWEATLNGGDISDNAFPPLDDHGDDVFVNLEDTNGGPIRVGIKYLVNTTKLTAGEVMFLTISHNDGTSSTSWTEVARLAFTPGIYLSNQVTEVDINTAISANWDLRVQVEYMGGATPASKGLIVLAPNQQGIWYYNYSAQDVTWPTDTVYPKGTQWTITVDGNDASYTQTTDMTGAAIAAAIEPTVEALTGVNSSVVNNDTGTAVRITLGAGGLPVVGVAKVFDDETRFWNPDVDISTGTDIVVGKILRNLSDGSEGMITASYENGVTVAELTGGSENRIRNGDLCIIVDEAKRWVLRQVNWSKRVAGDSITNPWPSIRDERISEVFYYRGRLGLLAGGAVLSEAGKPENLFRTATTQLLDSDPIDVKPAASGSTKFIAAAEWDRRMILSTDSVQYELEGEPLLTPSSVSLKVLSRFPVASIRPIVVGTRLYFARTMQRFTRLFEYYLLPQSQNPDARDMTIGVPRYLGGAPILLAGDTVPHMIAVRTDDDPNHLFVLNLHYEGDQRVQEAWSRWELDPTAEIIGMDFADGTLGMIVLRDDGVYLESVDLDDNVEAPYRLDRVVESDDLATAPTYSDPSTTWTLPYELATNGSEGVVVVVDEDGNVLTTTRPAVGTVRATGDYTGQNVTIGVQYAFSVTLSQLYPRNSDGVAETRGRTQVRSIDVAYANTRDFTVTVTPTGRNAKALAVSSDSEETGRRRVSVQSKNDQVDITITNSTPFPTCLTGLDWEGFLVNRSRRI